MQKFLPKQADIDKIFKVIQKKVFIGTHLPATVKEIQPEYLVSLYFKDIYLYLAQNKLPNAKTAIQKVETIAERYILLDSLLFKIITTPEKEMAIPAIPGICADKIITLYHTSLFAGHYLHSYIKGCHVCQLAHNEKPSMRQLQARINLNYRPISRLSMDLKVMVMSSKGHKYILCIIDEVTNYLITVPIHHSRSEDIGSALIENVISKYCVPEYIIMDQDSAFMSSLMNYLFKKLDIKIKTVAPYNHQSLQAEHGIKSLSTILMKHLTSLGQM